MAGLDNERFYPTSPDEVFGALYAAADRLFTIRGADPVGRSVTFGTPISGFSWGATMTAQVIAVEGGSYVRVQGAAKVRTNLTARRPEYKNTVKLLDAVQSNVQQAPSDSRTLPADPPPADLPPAGWYPSPQSPGRQQYWDGQQWTSHFSPE